MESFIVDRLHNLKILIGAGIIYKSARIDFRNCSTRNTAGWIIVLGSAEAARMLGVRVGSAIGHAIHPYVEWIGGFIGGMLTSFVAAEICSEACENVFERFEYNVETKQCADCVRVFRNNRYKFGDQNSCHRCQVLNRNRQVNAQLAQAVAAEAGVRRMINIMFHRQQG